MHEQLTTLLARWSAEGTEVMPPPTNDAVKRAFESLGSFATTDVLVLYGLLGGMQNMDKEYWRLWPLDEIGGQEPSKSGVAFSDYCLYCWTYRLLPVSANQSAVYVDHYDGQPPAMVAASLAEFFDRYVLSARALLDARSL